MSALITKILTWLNALVSAVTNQFSGDLSLDFLAVIFFLVVMLLIAFSLGRNRIVVAIISTYLAAFIYLILPWSDQIRAWLSLEQVFWVNLGIFAAAWLICYSVLVSSVLRSRASLGDDHLTGCRALRGRLRRWGLGQPRLVFERLLDELLHGKRIPRLWVNRLVAIRGQHVKPCLLIQPYPSLQ